MCDHWILYYAGVIMFTLSAAVLDINNPKIAIVNALFVLGTGLLIAAWMSHRESKNRKW